ncbi:hypothetical protein GF420_13075 [candidate division GN15 bacterium]|nr:hypothetical protein [candidate division GN15 bacterium]
MFNGVLKIAGRSRWWAGLLFAALIFGAAASHGQAPELPSDSLMLMGYRYFDSPIDPERYLIRPGERLRITFVGAQLPSLTLTVNPDGKIANANLGVFDVRGQTLAQTRADLLPVLGDLYNADEIDISVGEPVRVAITITGEVRTPGLYIGFTSQLVSEFIERAGGVTEFGSTRRITLTGGPSDIPVDLDRARYLGDQDANPPVYGGYRIHVPQRTNRVIHVIGRVSTPREIELLDGDDLDLLLSLAGGVRRDASVDGIYIVGDDQRDPTEPGAIRASDVIMVPERLGEDVSQSLMIFGAVDRPGRYSVSNDVTLENLIDDAGGLVADANRSRVTVFRRTREAVTEPVVEGRFPITVGRQPELWSSFVLAAGDSVFVPTEVGFVHVTGEVRNPGLVPYQAGKRASDYVADAGGFLVEADRQRIVITDRISHLTYQAGPDIAVSDGDEIRVERKEVLQ